MTDPSSLKSLVRNPLIRLLAVNWLIGLGITLLVIAGLFFTDAGGLWTLIARSEDPVVPIAMLFFGFLITLCSAAMGTAIMGLPETDPEGGSGRRLRFSTGGLAKPVPVRVMAKGNARRRA